MNRGAALRRSGAVQFAFSGQNGWLVGRRTSAFDVSPGYGSIECRVMNLMEYVVSVANEYEIENSMIWFVNAGKVNESDPVGFREG